MAPLRVFGTARPERSTADASRRPVARRLPILGAALALVLTGCSSEDVDSWKRGGLPEGATNHTDRITTLWQGAWVTLLLVGILVWALIFIAVVKYRRKPTDTSLPAQVRYNMPVEVTFTAVPLIMVLVYFFFTARDESEILEVSESCAGINNVSVVGKQWAWDWNYQTDDCEPDVFEAGRPGQQPPLVLPIDVPTKFQLETRDVNHSFYVPAFQFKMDLIAGRVNEFQVTPTKLGTFIGRCAELCGQDHSRMLFEVKVVTPEEYAAHLADLRERGQTGELGADLGRDQGGVENADEATSEGES